MDTKDAQICPKCKNTVSISDNYCSKCGKQLKEVPLSDTFFTQTWIYLLSIALPPLGLWPAYRYIKSSNQTSRIIGFIAVVLTLVSIVLTIWLTTISVNSLFANYSYLYQGSY